MKPLASALRRLMITLALIAVLAGGGILGLNQISARNNHTYGTANTFSYLDGVGEKAEQAGEYVSGQIGSYFQGDDDEQEGDDDEDDDAKQADDDHDEDKDDGEEAHEESRRIVATSPQARDVVITQQYVCQIHSRRHIEVRALERGYLEQVLVKEGQTVKKGDLMFKILSTIYQANLDAETAEAHLAQLEFNNTKRLYEQNVVSQNEVALLQAKLAKAQAKAQLASAELNFTNVTAPFDGIVDRQEKQLGSLIEEGDILTTLSDNSVMWVYFNVPEARYLEYMSDRDQHKENNRIELVLANGEKFPQTGMISAIEAKFNNETGNIPFRADFDNPNGLLRHGQTGNVLIHRTQDNALVIPQRATFEILHKRYVYVIDKDHVVHNREITIEHELDDIFVVKSGLKPTDKIVLEGVRQIHDGEEIEFEFLAPESVLANQKNHAE